MEIYFLKAEDGIRDYKVTGVQTCALPISSDKQLDITHTYESQKGLVNSHLIPLVRRSLNKKTFPVTDGVIKHIIHKRHRRSEERRVGKECRSAWAGTHYTGNK